MKNLHLLSMCTHIDEEVVDFLNSEFSVENNVFVSLRPIDHLRDNKNYSSDPAAFSPEYINQHHQEYRRIIIHSLFLSDDEILRLTDEAAKKIVWVVWGQDLYNNGPKTVWNLKMGIKEGIHIVKRIIRGTYLRAFKKKRQVSQKVSLFYGVGIGFSYDEKAIRKKYGSKVRVRYIPVSGKSDIDYKLQLREYHLNSECSETKVLLGHSGYHFLEHEKYLNKLSAYRSENIHIYMVLSYGASSEKIKYLKELGNSIFGEAHCTVITELMPVKEYMEFLSTMNVAIFPFRHQSALGNTKSMAFMGVKLFFDPRGVLYKGFMESGVKTYDCRTIGKITYEEFRKNDFIADTHAPLFRNYYPGESAKAWSAILE